MEEQEGAAKSPEEAREEARTQREMQREVGVMESRTADGGPGLIEAHTQHNPFAPSLFFGCPKPRSLPCAHPGPLQGLPVGVSISRGSKGSPAAPQNQLLSPWQLETEVAACWAAPAVLAAVGEKKGLHLLRPAASPLGADGGCLHACRNAGRGADQLPSIISHTSRGETNPLR